MKNSLAVLCVVALPAAAWAQAGPGPSATSQTTTVTVSELEGAVIEVSVARNQVVRREGKQFPTRMHQDWRIVIGPSDKITSTIDSTSHTPHGVFKGKDANFVHYVGTNARDQHFREWSCRMNICRWHAYPIADLQGWRCI
jgi:hypothetical protein